MSLNNNNDDDNNNNNNNILMMISELNKEFPAIWLVERFPIWRYLNRSRRLKYQLLGLATKRATFAISASKHGGQLVEGPGDEVGSFHLFGRITLSPGYLKGWRIFKVTAVILGPIKNEHLQVLLSFPRSRRRTTLSIHVPTLHTAGAREILIDQSGFSRREKI